MAIEGKKTECVGTRMSVCVCVKERIQYCRLGVNGLGPLECKLLIAIRRAECESVRNGRTLRRVWGFRENRKGRVDTCIIPCFCRESMREGEAARRGDKSLKMLCAYSLYACVHMHACSYLRAGGDNGEREQ